MYSLAGPGQGTEHLSQFDFLSFLSDFPKLCQDWVWPCRAGFAPPALLCSDFWGVGTAGLCPLTPELGLGLDWSFWGWTGASFPSKEPRVPWIKDFFLNFVIFMGFSSWFAGSSELNRASEGGSKLEIINLVRVTRARWD